LPGRDHPRPSLDCPFKKELSTTFHLTTPWTLRKWFGPLLPFSSPIQDSEFFRTSSLMFALISLFFPLSCFVVSLFPSALAVAGHNSLPCFLIFWKARFRRSSISTTFRITPFRRERCRPMSCFFAQIFWLVTVQPPQFPLIQTLLFYQISREMASSLTAGFSPQIAGELFGFHLILAFRRAFALCTWNPSSDTDFLIRLQARELFLFSAEDMTVLFVFLCLPCVTFRLEPIRNLVFVICPPRGSFLLFFRALFFFRTPLLEEIFHPCWRAPFILSELDPRWISSVFSMSFSSSHPLPKHSGFKNASRRWGGPWFPFTWPISFLVLTKKDTAFGSPSVRLPFPPPRLFEAGFSKSYSALSI